MIACNLYCQLFSLLTIILYAFPPFVKISDYDSSGFYELESDTSGSLSQTLISLLSYKPAGSEKLKHLVEGMQLSVGTSSSLSPRS